MNESEDIAAIDRKLARLADEIARLRDDIAALTVENEIARACARSLAGQPPLPVPEVCPRKA